MSGFKRYIILTAILTFAIPFSTTGHPTDYSKYKADSLAMEAYINTLRLHITQPIAVKIADTLFLMAKKLNLPRRQSLALSYKVDYYYSNRIADSMFAAIDDVQRFCKAHNQPVHYYFVWTRKINYYININRLNTAINEINLMLDDASKANYLPAQINGYKLIGRIYHRKKLYKESSDSYKAAIKLCENAPADVEIPNKHYLYLACAQTLPAQKRQKEMIPLLEKSLEYTDIPAERASVFLNFFKCYIGLKDYEKAKYYYNLAISTYPTQNKVGGLFDLLEAKLEIEFDKKDGHKIIFLLDSITNLLNLKNIYIGSYSLAYEYLGEFKKAYEYAQKQIKIVDSTAIVDMRYNMADLVVLTEANMLKNEKNRQELNLKNQKLLYTRFLLITSIIVLLVISLFLYRFLKLNHKLTKSENDLTKTVVKLEDESKAKSEFLHHLSHEVRIPLNTLIGFSSLLVDSNSATETNNKYGNVIQESSDIILKCVTDAIDITSSSNTDQIVDCDINSCFDAALEYSTIKIASDVVLKFEPYKGDKLIFSINKERVARILNNLIHNSAKFTKQGQIVVGIDVDTATKFITFTVTDTGIGIPKNMHDYVFEYFTKINSMSQGLGLGLPLGRYLAELMGGSLTLDANYTHGSRFVLRFPY